MIEQVPHELIPWCRSNLGSSFIYRPSKWWVIDNHVGGLVVHRYHSVSMSEDDEVLLLLYAGAIVKPLRYTTAIETQCAIEWQRNEKCNGRRV